MFSESSYSRLSANNAYVPDSQRYIPSKVEIESITASYSRAASRMEAAEKLSGSIDAVAKDAYDACISKYSYLNNTGEANSTDVFKAKCQRDISHYLRWIQYCLAVGGTGPLEEWAIAGQRE